MAGALAKVTASVENGNGLRTIFASNPEKNFSVPRNPLLYQMFENAALLVPDGIGMVLAAKVLYGLDIERVPGCELMQNICGLASDKGYRLFIYGARPAVNEEAVRKLRETYPGIQIVGNVHGYVPERRNGRLGAGNQSVKGTDFVPGAGFSQAGAVDREVWPAAQTRQNLSGNWRDAGCAGGESRAGAGDFLQARAGVVLPAGGRAKEAAQAGGFAGVCVAGFESQI